MNRAAATRSVIGAAFALAVALAAGCDGGTPSAPADASPGGDDDGGDGDGTDAAPPSGLTIRFVYLGADGQPVESGSLIDFDSFGITAMAMQLHRMEVVGENPPGGHLKVDSVVLDYPWAAPPQASFPTAAPGYYSQLDFRVERTYHDEPLPDLFGDDRRSIVVHGDAHLDDGDRAFEYVDEKNIQIQLALPENFELLLGMPATIQVELDLAQWFSAVSWQDLDDDEDEDGGDDNSGPGGGGGGGGEDGGPEGGGDPIRIGEDGDQPTADLMRQDLATAFRVTTVQ